MLRSISHQGQFAGLEQQRRARQTLPVVWLTAGKKARCRNKLSRVVLKD
jgi:hypothetical protein